MLSWSFLGFWKLEFTNKGKHLPKRLPYKYNHRPVGQGVWGHDVVCKCHQSLHTDRSHTPRSQTLQILDYRRPPHTYHYGNDRHQHMHPWGTAHHGRNDPKKRDSAILNNFASSNFCKRDICMIFWIKERSSRWAVQGRLNWNAHRLGSGSDP